MHTEDDVVLSGSTQLETQSGLCDSQDFTSQSSARSCSDWETENWSTKDKFNTAMALLSDKTFPKLDHQLKMSWEYVSKSSRSYYLKILSNAFQLITECVAPGQTNDVLVSVLHKITDEEKEETPDLMTEAMIQAYLQENDRNTQIQILSLFANKYTKEKLMELIPGLSVFKIDAARRHATFTSPGHLLNPPKVVRTRLSLPKIVHFIEFISSPVYHQAVGYGAKTLKLTSGIEIKIPKIIRNVISARLIATYLDYCKDVGFAGFQRTTLYSILKVCEATQKKNLYGLDNITAEGMRGIEILLRIVSKLEMFGLSSQKVEHLKHILSHVNQHLKFEIKSHIQLTSNCIDHCSEYSLSDPKCEQHRVQCDHSHDNSCNDCSLVNKVRNEVEESFESVKASIPEDIREEIVHDLDIAETNVISWRSHCVRAVHQEIARQEKLSNLKPNQALIVMDLAMKFLPIKFRETQADFFGKKGISWHIASVITSASDNNIETFDVSTFVHVLQLGSQGWFSVAHLIKDLISQLQLNLPHITEIYLKSDNAGCYHSSSLITFIQFLNSESPIKVLEYNFSEPQMGKVKKI